MIGGVDHTDAVGRFRLCAASSTNLQRIDKLTQSLGRSARYVIGKAGTVLAWEWTG